MNRKELSKLTNSVLDNNARCNVHIDIWHPGIEKFKSLLNLGHDMVDPNNKSDTCSIFGIWFDKFGYAKAPAIRFTVYCKDEAAEFMRERIKQGKEVINSEN